MRETLRIVQYVDALGHDLGLEGEQLRIVRGKYLPPALKELIIQRKEEIFDMLDRDDKAKQSGFLIGLSGTLYFKSISKNSNVYIEMINGLWYGWRETYQRGKGVATSLNEMSDCFEDVLLRIECYIQNRKIHRSEKRIGGLLMEDMNIKQRRFADYYIESGNAKESYLRAGYQAEGNSAEVNASRLLRNAKVMEYLEERNGQLNAEFIAGIEETKRFWTGIMRDNAADIRDRLKASEYIAKTNGAFIDKKEIQGRGFNKIEFGFVDPTKTD